MNLASEINYLTNRNKEKFMIKYVTTSPNNVKKVVMKCSILKIQSFLWKYFVLL